MCSSATDLWEPLQLVSADDWFLWYVFVSEDFSEAVLEITRG